MMTEGMSLACQLRLSEQLQHYQMHHAPNQYWCPVVIHICQPRICLISRSSKFNHHVQNESPRLNLYQLTFLFSRIFAFSSWAMLSFFLLHASAEYGDKME